LKTVQLDFLEDFKFKKGYYWLKNVYHIQISIFLNIRIINFFFIALNTLLYFILILRDEKECQIKLQAIKFHSQQIICVFAYMRKIASKKILNFLFKLQNSNAITFHIFNCFFSFVRFRMYVALLFSKLNFFTFKL